MAASDRPVVSSVLFREDGTALLTRASGELFVSPIENAVALGLVSGAVGIVDGYASVSGTGIVSVRATTYTEAGAASNLQVLSSSASDSSAGTGTRTLKVIYYRTDGTGPFTSTVTMNGTTAVVIGDANARFVEKLESVTVGSNGTNVGTITIRQNGGATIGTIAIGDGRTFWAHHYISAGRVGFVKRIIFGVETVSSDFFLRKTEPLVANSMDLQVTSRLRVVTGSNSLTFDFNQGLWLSGFARLTLHVQPDIASAGTVHGSFTFLDI